MPLVAADKLTDAAHERAFHQDGDLRFRIKHKIPIFIFAPIYEPGEKAANWGFSRVVQIS